MTVRRATTATAMITIIAKELMAGLEWYSASITCKKKKTIIQLDKWAPSKIMKLKSIKQENKL